MLRVTEDETTRDTKQPLSLPGRWSAAFQAYHPRWPLVGGPGCHKAMPSRHHGSCSSSSVLARRNSQNADNRVGALQLGAHGSSRLLGSHVPTVADKAAWQGARAFLLQSANQSALLGREQMPLGLPQRCFSAGLEHCADLKTNAKKSTPSRRFGRLGHFSLEC